MLWHVQIKCYLFIQKQMKAIRKTIKMIVKPPIIEMKPIKKEESEEKKSAEKIMKGFIFISDL